MGGEAGAAKTLFDVIRCCVIGRRTHGPRAGAAQPINM
jgi:hypothetical protein